MTSQPKEKSTDDGLASQATSVVVNLVKSVRGKTTGPLLFVARLVVYSITILTYLFKVIMPLFETFIDDLAVAITLLAMCFD